MKLTDNMIAFRKLNYWRGFKVGIIIGLLVACIFAYLAVYAARGWADEARATNYYYSLTQK